MKGSKNCTPIANANATRRRLSLRGFVRVAALLTIGASISMLLIMLVSGDPQLWRMSGALCLGTIAAIWTVTITIGLIVMIPVGIWRIS